MHLFPATLRDILEAPDCIQTCAPLLDHVKGPLSRSLQSSIRFPTLLSVMFLRRWQPIWTTCPPTLYWFCSSKFKVAIIADRCPWHSFQSKCLQCWSTKEIGKVPPNDTLVCISELSDILSPTFPLYFQKRWTKMLKCTKEGKDHMNQTSIS